MLIRDRNRGFTRPFVYFSAKHLLIITGE